MAKYWPLLVDEPFEGDALVNNQLRPPAGAVALDSANYVAAVDAITEVCGSWGGCAKPLVPLERGLGVDDKWSRILLESAIDGVERTELLSDEERQAYSDVAGPSSASLLRILVDVDPRPTVQTCRGISVEDPWHLAYFTALGDLPTGPDPQNSWNNLRDDLTYQDLVTIRGVNEDCGAEQLLNLLRQHDLASAVGLSAAKLTTGLQPWYNKSTAPEESRFRWDDDRIARHYGPNVVVIYEPASVEDLALVWNLRARFLHPPKLPLALPLSPSLDDDLQYLRRAHAVHYFGLQNDLAITSFSAGRGDLEAIGAANGFDVVEPWDVQKPIAGYCISSTEVAHFSGGRASIPAFSPTELQALGGSYLGQHQGSWMERKTTLVNYPLPVSRTMRRAHYSDPRYQDGPIHSGGKPGTFSTIRVPSGLEVMSAIGADSGVQLNESAPGKAAEQLIRASHPHLAMLASPGAVAALNELTRGRHVSIVRRRLNKFLSGADGLDETGDRYQVLFDRLNSAVGAPEAEELNYLKFEQVRRLLHVTRTAAEQWLQWALASGLVLRGVEAKCMKCGQKQWRPLTEAVPRLICHGCSRTIDNPHGFKQIEYRYRASELLLRAMSHDVLPCVLALRHIAEVMGGESRVFGGYPGIEIRDPDSSRVAAEVDGLIVLANGALILGECKVNARGLNPEELDKLWNAADRLGARATFAATLDRSSACGDEWLQTSSPTGRPHFALTAEHLFDLSSIGPTLGEEYFDWREDYRPGITRFASSTITNTEKLLAETFSNYLERAGNDYEQHQRSPWMRGRDD